MDTALSSKFPAEQRITISNPKMKGYVITRPWRSAMHLVDKGWEIIGSEAIENNKAIKKSSENADASLAATTVKNNLDLFTLKELQDKYKIIYKRKPFHKWGKEKLLEKIKDAKED